MIDRNARDRLALALRQLASGLITNDDFDDDAFAACSCRNDDAALAELATYGWLHYSDCSTYNLKGRHALSREQRTSIARAVLFLKTDQEYVHKDAVKSVTCLGKPFIRDCLIATAIATGAGLIAQQALGAFWLGFAVMFALAHLGQYLMATVVARVRQRQMNHAQVAVNETFWPFLDKRAEIEQFRFWPFANKDLYEVALANPRVLQGPVSKPG